MIQELSEDYLRDILEHTPRPHYLCGSAKYSVEGNIYKILTKANFSSEKNPSIADRVTMYLDYPHVNVGHCLFGLWNAVHIIAKIEGYKKRTLKKKKPITIQPMERVIPPDTELELEAVIRKEKEFTREGKIHSSGTIYGSYSLDGKELVNITATYYAEK